MSKLSGCDFSLALSTVRVPLNNPLAGTYLEISSELDLIRLVSEAWHQVPQILIPPINDIAIDTIDRRIKEGSHFLSERMNELFHQVINCFKINNASFTDQIASAQSLVMSATMSIKQLTLESENVAVNFF